MQHVRGLQALCCSINLTFVLINVSGILQLFETVLICCDVICIGLYSWYSDAI